LKDQLVEMSIPGTGRAPLHSFYTAEKRGIWNLKEPVELLRLNGLLDETVPGNPLVLIPNYVLSHTNCLNAEGMFGVCCIDECQSLLGKLEEQVGAPEATVDRLADLLARLPSATVSAPRQLPEMLRSRLKEAAAAHGGTVLLHSRLFSQVLHLAYPNECPFPHEANTTVRMTDDTWGKTYIADGRSQTTWETFVAENEAPASAPSDLQIDGMFSLVEEHVVGLGHPQPARRDRSALSSLLRMLVFVAIIGSGVLASVQTVNANFRRKNKYGDLLPFNAKEHSC
jgi:hypothetical protein